MYDRTQRLTCRLPTCPARCPIYPCSLVSRAGPQHVLEDVHLDSSYREVPLRLHLHPPFGVGTPAGRIQRPSLVGRLRSLPTVHTRGGGVQRAVVVQVIGVCTFAITFPLSPARDVRVGQGHVMIDVQVAGFVDSLTSTWIQPLPGVDGAVQLFGGKVVFLGYSPQRCCVYSKCWGDSI